MAWMIRKNSPKLKAEIAEFAKQHGGKSAFGNELLKKYGGDGNPRVVKQATSADEIKKFKKTVEFFRKYGAQYDMDYLLMVAQGYQESLLDQNARSSVGAIGVMQLMPATAKEMKTGDVTQLEPNIHAGIKYMRFVRDQFFESDPWIRATRSSFRLPPTIPGQPVFRNSGRKRSNVGSIRTSGLTTSRSSPRDESARKRSPMWPTFISTTSPINWSRNSRPQRKKLAACSCKIFR